MGRFGRSVSRRILSDASSGMGRGASLARGASMGKETSAFGFPWESLPMLRAAARLFGSVTAYPSRVNGERGDGRYRIHGVPAASPSPRSPRSPPGDPGSDTSAVAPGSFHSGDAGRGDKLHYTVGGGIVVEQKFQADVAVSVSNIGNEGLVSFIYRY